MNSAPSKMKSAATDTSEEIRNSAECTALRAITVNNPARIMEIAKIQKNTVSQPERIISLCFVLDLRQRSFFIYQLTFANSIWKCNRSLFEKYFVRGPVTKSLARAVVKKIFHLLQVLVCDPGEFILLGKILPNETVGVFVEAAFPAGIRVGEVKTRMEPGGDQLVLTKLFTVVYRYGVHPGSERG